MKLRQKILLPSPSNEYENQLNRILYHEIDDITTQVGTFALLPGPAIGW